MPRGGRRFGATGSPAIATCAPPRPPKGLEAVELEAWREVARQIRALGTYSPAAYSAFRLAVIALADVYRAPPDLKATTKRSLLECASKLIGRFGLDPVSRAQVVLPAPPQKGSKYAHLIEGDELDEFLEDDVDPE